MTRRSARRPLWIALLCLAFGSALVLFAGSRTWQAARCPAGPVPAGPCVPGAGGPDALTALALVALAGVVALFAVGGLLRRTVGALLVVVGAGVVTICATHPAVAAWKWCAAAGGGLVSVGGAVVAWQSAAWPVMSSRYEREKQRAARPPRDAWEAIDRGEDPTA